jgi:hypothetical protein
VPILLPVKSAVIHGDDLKLEGEDVKTAVDWRNRRDELEWSLDVPRAGLYEVEMEYASGARDGGGMFRLTVNSRRFTATVVPTRGWDQYQWQAVGRLYLRAGPATAVMQPLFLQPDHALMNLRTVRVTLVQEVPEPRRFRRPVE